MCFFNQPINYIPSFTICVTALAFKFPLHALTGGSDRLNDAVTMTDDCNKLQRVSTSLCRWHGSWWLFEPSGCQRAVTLENWSQGLGWKSHSGKVCEGRRGWLTLAHSKRCCKGIAEELISSQSNGAAQRPTTEQLCWKWSRTYLPWLIKFLWEMLRDTIPPSFES